MVVILILMAAVAVFVPPKRPKTYIPLTEAVCLKEPYASLILSIYMHISDVDETFTPNDMAQKGVLRVTRAYYDALYDYGYLNKIGDSYQINPKNLAEINRRHKEQTEQLISEWNKYIESVKQRVVLIGMKGYIKHAKEIIESLQ